MVGSREANLVALDAWNRSAVETPTANATLSPFEKAVEAILNEEPAGQTLQGAK